MSIQTTAPFIWKEIALSEVVFVDGVPHTTRRAIGEWLEYADPQKAIDNILARNPHLEAHTIPLNLRGMDGARDYETSVSPLRGSQVASALGQGTSRLEVPFWRKG